jgi:hypothetical protein
MENSLWSFGCSFTAEYHPIDNYPPTTYDFYKEWKGGKLPDIWPTILSKKLNLKNKNNGVGATSNYEIFYSFCEVVSELKKGDIVLVQWTSPYRFILANPNEHYLMTILPNQTNIYPEFDTDFLEKLMVNRSNQVWLNELIYYTKIINEICKEKNVHLFYWTYHEDIIFSYIETTWPQFNTDKILKSPQKNEYLISYLSKICKNKHTIAGETDEKIQDAHLGEIGHQTQAELFYDYIKQRI